MKQVIYTESAPKAIGPYSQAILAGNTLYISGQVPIVPATGALCEGGIQEQTEQALKNIGEILKAAGFGYENVVKSTVLLTDMANFKAMNEVYARFYTTNPPARAAYAVVGLPMGALVEIETIAVKE